MRQIPDDHVPGQPKQLVAEPVEFLQTIKKMHQLGHLQRGGRTLEFPRLREYPTYVQFLE
ncbi:MAG: hypothetical protein EBS30_09745 [Planctomycetes bacterium]|nr:hypothetical protein [Planctomycetota bacterium]